MEIVSLSASVLAGSMLAIVGVAAAKWIIKKIFKTETPTLGALVLLYVISFVVAAGAYGWQFLSPVVQTAIAAIFGTSIVIYDVVVKGIWEGGLPLIKKALGF